jgi:hypothetical protein
MDRPLIGHSADRYFNVILITINTRRERRPIWSESSGTARAGVDYIGWTPMWTDGGGELIELNILRVRAGW